ncbi:hypothetical protein DHEL01_v209911 [Diaporthe helianthi]|uniref:Uncharacterized protein n=1 Tax=Diaporthe helianthi TaxID=158607 RepID=A0A2P5HN85_DIAHE|nr:hypothetical protein DHEL01_v209911 [Diaporthe helianthi]
MHLRPTLETRPAILGTQKPLVFAAMANTGPDHIRLPVQASTASQNTPGHCTIPGINQDWHTFREDGTAVWRCVSLPNQPACRPASSCQCPVQLTGTSGP